jgi:hypothetical protein
MRPATSLRHPLARASIVAGPRMLRAYGLPSAWGDSGAIHEPMIDDTPDNKFGPKCGVRMKSKICWWAIRFWKFFFDTNKILEVVRGLVSLITRLRLSPN